MFPSRNPLFSQQLPLLVASLSGEQLLQLLLFCREWNSNSKMCLVAQRVLRAVLRSHAPKELMQVRG